MVTQYLTSSPDPAMLEFLRYDFAGLTARYGGVVATTFRASSYPRRYIEVADAAARRSRLDCPVEALELPRVVTHFTRGRFGDAAVLGRHRSRDCAQGQGARGLRVVPGLAGPVNALAPRPISTTSTRSCSAPPARRRESSGAWTNSPLPSAIPTCDGAATDGLEEDQISGLHVVAVYPSVLRRTGLVSLAEATGRAGRRPTARTRCNRNRVTARCRRSGTACLAGRAPWRSASEAAAVVGGRVVPASRGRQGALGRQERAAVSAHCAAGSRTRLRPPTREARRISAGAAGRHPHVSVPS